MNLHRCYFPVVLSLFWITHTGYCLQSCSQVAEVNTEHEIVGNVTASGFTEFTWRNPVGVVIATCRVHDSCQKVGQKYEARMSENSTASILKIINVAESDSGMWSLLDSNSDLSYNVCHIITAAGPQCNISSSGSTYDLDLGDNMTLTADISGYYCPEPAEFSLITGDVTESFSQNSTENVTNTVIINSFSITSGRFGKVDLNYSCDGDSWMLMCVGVKELLQIFKGPPTTTEGPPKTSNTRGDNITTPVSTATQGPLIPIVAGVTVGGLILIFIIVIIITIVHNRRKPKYGIKFNTM